MDGYKAQNKKEQLEVIKQRGHILSGGAEN